MAKTERQRPRITPYQILHGETGIQPHNGAATVTGVAAPLVMEVVTGVDVSNPVQAASAGLAFINLIHRTHEKPAKTKLELTIHTIEDAALATYLYMLPILWQNFSQTMESLSKNEFRPETAPWLAAAFVFGIGFTRTARVVIPPAVRAARFVNAHWPRPKLQFPRIGTLGITKEQQDFVQGKRLTPPQYRSDGAPKSDLEIMSDQQGRYLESADDDKTIKE